MRDVQSSVLRMLHAYGIPSDIVEEYDCVPVRIRQVGDTLKLQTMFGARCITAVDGNGHRVQTAFEVAEALAQKHIKGVPRFIRNRYGDAFIRDGDRYFYMTDWLPGRGLDVHQPSQIEGALVALAQWHLAAKGTLGQTQDAAAGSFTGQLGHLSDVAREFWERTRDKSKRTEFERLFAGFAKETLTTAEEVRQELDQVGWDVLEAESAVKGWLCHGRLNAEEIRYDGENYHITNYQYVHPGCPMTDVANFLEQCAEGHQWDVQAIQSAAQLYLDAVAQDGWGSYLWSIVAAPMATLRLVEHYQMQDSPDEGLYADALEQALVQDRDKMAALSVLRRQHTTMKAQRREALLAAEPASGTSDGGDVGHADLKTTEMQSVVDAEVAGLSSKTRRVTHLPRSYKPSTADEAEDGLRIKRYRPKRQSGATEGRTNSEPVKLWGDATDPSEE